MCSHSLHMQTHPSLSSASLEQRGREREAEGRRERLTSSLRLRPAAMASYLKSALNYLGADDLVQSGQMSSASYERDDSGMVGRTVTVAGRKYKVLKQIAEGRQGRVRSHAAGMKRRMTCSSVAKTS